MVNRAEKTNEWTFRLSSWEVLWSSRLPVPKKWWSYTEVAITLSNFCQPKSSIVYCQLCSNVCITAQTKLLSVGQHCETNPNSLWNLPGEIFHPLLRINYTRKNNAEQWLNVTRTYPKWKSGDSLFCPYNENQTTLVCTTDFHCTDKTMTTSTNTKYFWSMNRKV